MKPSEKQNASMVGVLLLLAILMLFVSWNTAGAQDNPLPTATQNCWVEDGQMVCIGEGPVSITATPTATPILSPTFVPTPTPQPLPTTRPLIVPCPPWRSCAWLPGEATAAKRWNCTGNGDRSTRRLRSCVTNDHT